MVHACDEKDTRRPDLESKSLHTVFLITSKRLNRYEVEPASCQDYHIVLKVGVHDVSEVCAASTPEGTGDEVQLKTARKRLPIDEGAESQCSML